MITVNNEVQPGSNSGFFGSVEEVEAWGVSGWFIDAAQTSTLHMINAYINGVHVGTAKAMYHRADISAVLSADAYCGFRLLWDKTKLHDVIAKHEGGGDLELVMLAKDNTVLLSTPYQPTLDDCVKWALPSHVYGNLDLIDQNLNVIGWAIDARKSDKAHVELVIDGQVVAKVAGNLPRPDLGVLKPSYILSGFKVKVPASSITRLRFTVETRVAGYPLPGSPLSFDLASRMSISDPRIERGYLIADLLNWPGGDLRAALYIDGEFEEDIFFRSTLPNGRRSDVATAAWQIKDDLADGHPRIYCLVIRDSNTVIRSDSLPLSYPEYISSIDSASPHHLAGWAFNTSSSASLNLGLYKSGVLVHQAKCDVYRPDVTSSFKDSPHSCGFFFDLGTENESTAEYFVKDLDTDIIIGEISIASPYEALQSIATEIVDVSRAGSKALKHVLSELISRQNGNSVHFWKKLPKISGIKDISSLDVIIPVYGGAAETVECVESVLAAVNKKAIRVVVINDCTTDPLIKSYLDALEARGLPNVMVVHRQLNGGFSAAVNTGFVIAGNKDVVLLNADTVVQNGWVDRICAAADQDPLIGTVTPISNNAEICSVPYICKSLEVSNPLFAQVIDATAARVNAGRIVDIPVAVGFCMFIRRECLSEIGYFDAAKWGRGYGEEVDFCLQASSRGWRHVMLGDTFVIHRGNVSFGSEKLERVKESARKISEQYPFYDSLIQRFLSSDPGRAIRRGVNLALISDFVEGKRILHITHSFGGGTGKYLRDLCAIHSRDGDTPILLHFDSSGASSLDFDLSHYPETGFFSAYHREVYGAADNAALMEDIKSLNIDQVHIHAPFGVPVGFVKWLTHSYPYVVTVHDYSWICPQVTLSPAAKYCGEPSVATCNGCVKFHKPHGGLLKVLEDVDGDVAKFRDTYRPVIANAERVIVGAHDVQKRMERFGMEGAYRVVPHAAPPSTSRLPRARASMAPASSGFVKVALIGGISDIKGFYTLKACAVEALAKKLPVEFIVFGHTMDDASLTGLTNIRILGRYKEAQLDSLIKHYQPHVAFFPNKSPETFSYTLSHAFRLGLWPVSSHLGAPAERIRNMKFGRVLDENVSVEETVHILLEEGIKRAGIFYAAPEDSLVFEGTYSSYISYGDKQDEFPRRSAPSQLGNGVVVS